MGLFKKKEPELPKPEVKEIFRTVIVNLTDKMLQVELIDDEAYLAPCNLKQNGDLLQIIHSGILIATIGKRGKAYAELLPYINQYIKSVTIKAKTGDYGEYYKVSLRIHEGTVVE